MPKQDLPIFVPWQDWQEAWPTRASTMAALRFKRVGFHFSSYRVSQTCAHYRDVHLDQDLHTIELLGRVCKKYVYSKSSRLIWDTNLARYRSKLISPLIGD